MATGELVLEEAGSLLNDWGLTIFTKEQLFRLMKQGHRELQVKLVLNGIPVIKEKSDIITIPAGDEDMGANQPTDLIEPISCHERTPNTTDDFQDMFERGWEPELQQSDILQYWVWRGELIKFLGATAAREVKLYYKGGIDVPTQEGDPLGFLFAENFLSPITASKMAFILGNKNAALALKGQASENLDDVIRMNVIGQQALPARRIPYRRGRTQRF
jgi:hypothetical protein